MESSQSQGQRVNSTELLKGFTLLDLSYRLPGPLSTLLLSHLGAKIIKIEDQNYQDPFAAQYFPQKDSTFSHWYKELNKGKEIIRLNFESPSFEKEMEQLQRRADGMILGLPPSLQKKLGAFPKEPPHSPPMAVVELQAHSHQKRGLHDLNALALSGILKLHTQKATENILAPPFLPIAGISFGLKTALQLLAALLQVQKTRQSIFTRTFLFDSAQEVLSPLWPSALRETRERLLHNGRYPCYCLYRLGDHRYAALASVESKFWNRFCQVFDLPLKSEDRFHNETQRVFNLLSQAFLQKNAQQIEQIIQKEDLCLSLV